MKCRGWFLQPQNGLPGPNVWLCREPGTYSMLEIARTAATSHLRERGWDGKGLVVRLMPNAEYVEPVDVT
ncbi:MAG: hypothetical protein COT81_02700 [Candidatus Buchananbacteria bacterium CG10_big_fil_rev_8_21_14_0_10_42_9]|uniref:Uncharacterized protein n=1 Tax=Candidatus Buchananbacteria bacterium CG10_big_fil_rev_8_21_14_0_10_42_9 TaxID=1974526 RepID=A0A2H0W1A7_9BACT|nr:MAG: hypothetical protein COT81_02700 [Candidatus Buchananbacteria bacterium CG10_big_fil_rev_8_21_14_0_10_42_9]